MDTRHMLTELVPARVQVALHLIDCYFTPQLVPNNANPLLEFKPWNITKEEAEARRVALGVLRDFMLGEHDYRHGVYTHAALPGPLPPEPVPASGIGGGLESLGK